MPSIADPDVKNIVAGTWRDAGSAAQKSAPVQRAGTAQQRVQAQRRAALDRHESARKHYARGVEDYINRNLHGAIYEFRAAIEDVPQHRLARIRLRRCIKELADLKADVEDAQSHIAMHPQDAERRVELADMLSVLGRHKEAMAELKAAAALPDSYWAKRATKLLAKVGR